MPYINAIYSPVYNTNCRYIDIWGGRGRGGSHFGTAYFLHLLTLPDYFRGYFVRMAFNDIKDSLFQDIKDRISEDERFDISDFNINNANYSVHYKPTGNFIKSKGFMADKNRTAKMKSLAGATHVLIEEANEISGDDFNMLDLSLRTTKADKIEIIRIFNPPSKNHWIWRDYNLHEKKININGKDKIYFMAEPKTSSNILSIFSTYKDNIDNLQKSTITKLESFRDTDTEYYCNQVLGLISEGAKGRIYSGWQMITDGAYKALELPKVYVIDFGYSGDPNAIIEVKYEKEYRYIRQMLYESGLDNIELAKRILALGITTRDLIIADYGAGGDHRIAELRRINRYADLEITEGFNIRSAVKGIIKVGINKVRSCKIFMTESSADGWNEYREYKWALDVEKNPTDTPVDKYNHIMDCIRYFEMSKDRYY